MMATISPYNLIHDLLDLLQKHQNSLQLQMKIMESESQKASFERLLEDEFSAYVRENRRGSTSIISDSEGNDWNVRCNDVVAEEIREERKQLEGKKLDFDEVCSDDDHDEQQQEVRSLGSSVSDGQESSLLNSSSCLSDDKKVDFGASLGDFDHCLIASPGSCVEEKMDLVEEKKSGHFDLCLIASPGFCVEKKSGHFVADLGEKNGCDERLDLVDGEKKKKSGDFDANLGKRMSGRCRVSKWLAVVTMGVVVLGMFILMSFDLGKDEGFLVPT